MRAYVCVHYENVHKPFLLACCNELLACIKAAILINISRILWFVSFALWFFFFISVVFVWSFLVCSQALSPEVLDANSSVYSFRIFRCCCTIYLKLFTKRQIIPSLSLSLCLFNVADLFTFVLFVCFDKQYYRIVSNDDIFCSQYI